MLIAFGDSIEDIKNSYFLYDTGGDEDFKEFNEWFCKNYGKIKSAFCGNSIIIDTTRIKVIQIEKKEVDNK